jgi:hypothetical protein
MDQKSNGSKADRSSLGRNIRYVQIYDELSSSSDGYYSEKEEEDEEEAVSVLDNLVHISVGSTRGSTSKIGRMNTMLLAATAYSSEDDADGKEEEGGEMEDTAPSVAS